MTNFDEPEPPPPLDLSLTADEQRQKTLDWIKRRDAARADADADMSAPPVAKPTTSPPRSSASPSRAAVSPAKTNEQFEAEWRSSDALQAEFPTAECYAAYKRAEASGKVRTAPAVCQRFTSPPR